MEWNDFCRCDVVGMIRKIEKSMHFERKIMKNVKNSTTWRKFFMGTWTRSFFCRLILRCFPVVILRFFAFAVFVDGVALSFSRLRFRVFFAIFAGFDRFRFLRHEQFRYRG